MMMGSLHLRLIECHHEDLWTDTEHWNYVHAKAPYWRFYWHDRAGAVIRHGEEVIALEPGRIILVPPNVVFSTSNQERIHQLYIHFQVLTPFMRPQSGIIVVPVDPCVRSLIEELSGVLGHDEDQSWRLLLTAQALVEMALSRTTEAMIRIPRIDSRIQEAMAHIDEHFGEALQNRAMASLVGLGQDSFIRLFKAQTGDTPRVYLRQKRIEQACLSLRFSEDSIEQIADDTGFCDRYHFTRVFRRVQGMGPATFRRVHRTRLPGRASESGLQAGRD